LGVLLAFVVLLGMAWLFWANYLADFRGLLAFVVLLEDGVAVLG